MKFNVGSQVVTENIILFEGKPTNYVYTINFL